MIVTEVQTGRFEWSPIKPGQVIWVKRKKNPSTRVMSIARSARVEAGEWKIIITKATGKEGQNYKSRKVIKKLKNGSTIKG